MQWFAEAEDNDRARAFAVAIGIVTKSASLVFRPSSSALAPSPPSSSEFYDLDKQTEEHDQLTSHFLNLSWSQLPVVQGNNTLAVHFSTFHFASLLSSSLTFPRAIFPS